MKYSNSSALRHKAKWASLPLQKTLNAFVGGAKANTTGNPCQLHIYGAQPESISCSEQLESECHSWPHETEQNTVVVRCYNKQHLIRCCGHGLLTTAKWWMQQTATSSLALAMHDSNIQARITNDVVWLKFKRLPTYQCEVPSWVSNLPIGSPPTAAALAGGDSGYLILQWPDNYPIEHLARPGDLLSHHTQRALIYTARQPITEPSTTKQYLQENSDIHYRYFAPQYGIAEDSATGSAMRVLADYWAAQFTTISALQCSPRKGYLMSRVSDNYVEVGGYCLETKSIDTNGTELNQGL